jgi:hypothetical protein
MEGPVSQDSSLPAPDPQRASRSRTAVVVGVCLGLAVLGGVVGLLRSRSHDASAKACIDTDDDDACARACDADRFSACLALGRLALDGADGGAPDRERALSAFRRACDGDDAQAWDACDALAREDPGKPVIRKDLPARAATVLVVPAFAEVPLDDETPVPLRVGAFARSTAHGVALFDGLGPVAAIAGDAPYLVEPSSAAMPMGEHGVAIAVRAILVQEPPDPYANGKWEFLDAPEKVLELVTAADQVVLRWKQGGTVLALEELPRSADVLSSAVLAEHVEAQWKLEGRHHDPVDEKRDQAILRAGPAATFAEVLPLVQALLTPKRSMRGAQVSAFQVSVRPSAAPRSLPPSTDAAPAWTGPPPKVELGAIAVSGRLAPEVIRRLLEERLPAVVACYENGLLRLLHLEGRVSVRFVIGADGAPSNVGNGGSDLPDGDVVACTVRTLWGSSFPRPDRGIVTVTAPFLMRPR